MNTPFKRIGRTAATGFLVVALAFSGFFINKADASGPFPCITGARAIFPSGFLGPISEGEVGIDAMEAFTEEYNAGKDEDSRIVLLYILDGNCNVQ